MTTLTGTGTLVRLFFRRDRVRTPIWILVAVMVVAITPGSIRSTNPTTEDLAAYAAAAEDNPALIAMAGPPRGLATVGGRVAYEILGQAAVLVGLMSVLLVGRHTRGEEEAGRTELLRAGVLGRHAPIAAAMTVAAAANVAIGAGVAVVLATQDLPVTGSILMGAGLAAAGIVFAAIAAVAAQATEFARGTYTWGIVALGAAFLLRAIGDIGDGTLSWLSPIGWSQALHPYTGDRAWPLIIPAAASAAFIAGAIMLDGRRDLGAGLIRPRPGARTASDLLIRPVGLALRLQRTVLLSWAAGIFLIGLAYGSIGQDVEELIGDNPELRDTMAQAGGDNLVDSFFATTMMMTALIAGGFAVQSALRLRSEETAGRAEPLLTTGLPRWRWAMSHLTVALAGCVVMMVAAGAGTGLAHGARTGDAGEVVSLIGAGLAHVPALWLLIGVTAALFGLLPRFSAVAWALVGLVFVIGLLGELLQLPGWLRGVSPFDHVPQLPAQDFSLMPELALSGLAIALLVAGLVGFRRRDAG